MIFVGFILGVFTVLALRAYTRRRLQYWSSRGVISPPALPFFGHALQLYSKKKGRWQFEQEIYKTYGGSTFAGIYEFHRPILLIGDPEIMKYILVRDFDHFTDRRIQPVMTNDRDSIMNLLLTAKRGQEWKSLRSIISPAFTSGKMKAMYPLICTKADDLVSFCLLEAAQKPYLDMKYNFGRYTLDSLASCAFGIECNSLLDKDAEFIKNVNAFSKVTPWRLCKFLFYRFSPKLFSVLGLRLNPPELDFLREAVTHTISERRKGGNRREDFLDLLLDMEAPHTSESASATTVDPGVKDRNKEHLSQGLDDKTIVAQCLLFLVAGYDTSSSTLAFASFLLAKHPNVQNRLRVEINDILRENGGQLPYSAIMEAKFMDACIMETLRLYPPGARLQRVCTKSYTLPGYNFTISEGQMVQCLVWSVHHDPKYWPDPELFLPDRFMPEKKGEINSFTHMPFGMGPRNCAGMRFAMMETKVVLAKLLLAVEMTLPPGFTNLVLEGGNAAVLRPKHAVNIVLTPLEKDD